MPSPYLFNSNDSNEIKINAVLNNIKAGKQLIADYISQITDDRIVEFVHNSCSCKIADLVDSIPHERRLTLADRLTELGTENNTPNVEKMLIVETMLDKDNIRQALANLEESETDNENESKY